MAQGGIGNIETWWLASESQHSTIYWKFYGEAGPSPMKTDLNFLERLQQ
jgi:hypothetical protein